MQSKYTDAIVYELINEEGPDHNKEFTVAVTLNNEKLGEVRKNQRHGTTSSPSGY